MSASKTKYICFAFNIAIFAGLVWLLTPDCARIVRTVVFIVQTFCSINCRVHQLLLQFAAVVCFPLATLLCIVTPKFRQLVPLLTSKDVSLINYGREVVQQLYAKQYAAW